MRDIEVATLGIDSCDSRKAAIGTSFFSAGVIHIDAARALDFSYECLQYQNLCAAEERFYYT
jgi:hypothetical protein